MQSRYNESEAPPDGDLALRRYTALLLAGDGAVLPDGSSHSVKGRDQIAGEAIDVVWVSADGDPSRYAALRLQPLCRVAEMDLDHAQRRLCALRERLDPEAPEPSADALLHAFVPSPYVDIVEAEALQQLLNQSDAEQRCLDVFGADALYVPDDGGLMRSAATRWRAFVDKHGKPPTALLLDRHGAAVWGDDAQQSYQRAIKLVGVAQRAMARDIQPSATTPHHGHQQDEARRAVTLAMRGCLLRAGIRGAMGVWRTSSDVLRFTEQSDLEDVVNRGPANRQHAALTGPWPLVLHELDGATADKLPALLDEAIESHARRYRGWAESHGADPAHLADADPWPRVVLVEGLGMLALGQSYAAARRISDAYAHNIRIMSGAEALGRYAPADGDAQWHAIATAAARAQPRATKPLTGRVVLVTGAASGIGLAVSRTMLAAGAHVVITDRDPRVVEAVSEWPQQRYPERVKALVCDVTSTRACQRTVAETCDAFGGIDVLVSNAGIAPSGDLHTDSGDAALRTSLDVNLLGHQRIARAASEAMIAQGAGGVLLFNASRIAFNQGPAYGPYAVPKAALVALMRQYAIDLGRYGIRANAVNADRVRTHLFAPGVVEQQARAKGISPSEYFRANLLRRETSTEQVADAFIYLANAEATTGCIVTVDGGNPAAFPR